MAQTKLIVPLREIFVSPRNNNIVVSLHKKLIQDKVHDKRLHKLPLAEKLNLLYTYPPIMHHPEGSNNFIVVAHHCMYKAMELDLALPNRCLELTTDSMREYLVAANVTAGGLDNETFLAHKISEMIDKIQRIDRLDNKHIKAIIAASQDPSPSTSSRNNAIKAHQICPKCKGALLGPLNRMPIDPHAATKLYKVTCYNSHMDKRVPAHASPVEHRIKQKRCDFYAILNAYEFERFRSRDFPTYVWLNESEGQRCRCGGKLYIRTIFKGPKETEKKVICQYNDHSVIKKCEYEEDFKTWQPQLLLL
jgi:hypothetical protein